MTIQIEGADLREHDGRRREAGNQRADFLFGAPRVSSGQYRAHQSEPRLRGERRRDDGLLRHFDGRELLSLGRIDTGQRDLRSDLAWIELQCLSERIQRILDLSFREIDLGEQKLSVRGALWVCRDRGLGHRQRLVRLFFHQQQPALQHQADPAVRLAFQQLVEDRVGFGSPAIGVINRRQPRFRERVALLGCGELV